MTQRSPMLLILASLCLFSACDNAEDDADVTIEGAAGKADGLFPPTSFPGVDTHCNGVFSDCDRDAAFGGSRWGSLGASIDRRGHSGDGITVRAFIESDALESVRPRLYFSPEPVSSLQEAERIGIVEATGTRTGFGGNGMEVRLTAVVQPHMIDGGRVDGVFYAAFSGADGRIRAIDIDL